MVMHEIIALLITFTAVASYINNRYVRLPPAIGVMLITLVIALIVIFLAHQGLAFGQNLQQAVIEVDFSETVLNGMLSFLLFAGALHINVLELAEYRTAVFSLATVSVIISTIFVGSFLYWASGLIGFQVPLLSCFIFGAIISPTDPIAVLSIFKDLSVPKNIEIKIIGESLFNDGISIVLFVILLGGVNHEQPTLEIFLREFAQQAGGAILIGTLLGLLVAYLIRTANNLEVSCLLTLALVTGGFVFADTIVDVSGPIVMVVAGLIIGHNMRAGHMSNSSLDRLDGFWKLIDGLLNAVLFALIGLEVLEFIVDSRSVILGFLVIPIVLLARLISVSIPLSFFSRYKMRPQLAAIMTWSGLRGAVSLALALQVPQSAGRDTLVIITYFVVLFSLLIQGTTIRPVIVKLLNLKESEA